MPKAKIAARGGARNVRTIRIRENYYAHVYVVNRPGPRGGRTVLGEVKRRKGKGKR